MQPPMLNGVQKPADVIARGPHRYDEATRKYVELPQSAPSPYPRAMFHETLGASEAASPEQQRQMESERWKTTPFPPKPEKKENVVAPAADLALIVLQQQQTMKAQAEQMETMQRELAKLAANQPTTAPAIAELPHRGRPKSEVKEA
jgi:hypothetical protein